MSRLQDILSTTEYGMSTSADTLPPECGSLTTLPFLLESEYKNPCFLSLLQLTQKLNKDVAIAVKGSKRLETGSKKLYRRRDNLGKKVYRTGDIWCLGNQTPLRPDVWISRHIGKMNPFLLQGPQRDRKKKVSYLAVARAVQSFRVAKEGIVTGRQQAISGWRLMLSGTKNGRFCNRKSRGPGGHTGKDKGNRPPRQKPPWKDSATYTQFESYLLEEKGVYA